MSQDQSWAGPQPVEPGRQWPAPPTNVPVQRDAPPAWATAPTQPSGGYVPVPQQPVPPQWTPPGPPAAPPEPPSRGGIGVLTAVILALVLLVAAGGTAWWIWHRSSGSPPAPAAASTQQGSGSANASSQPATPSSAQATPPPRPSPTAGPTTGSVPGGASNEQAALAQLGSLRADSLQRVVLDGRWVAQVASKSVGITDPLQTAANGTHTFYATDILAESLAARSTVDDPSKVYVLWGTDFGKRSTAPDGSPYWVTVVDAGYASHDNVLEWCAVTFPTLTPDQLADTCAPRQLDPPHD